MRGEEAAPDTLPITDVTHDDDLCFSDGIGVSLNASGIVIENAATGASRAFPKDALKILDRFTDWTSVSALIRYALETEADMAAVDRAMAVLRDLLEIDVLTTRRKDLTGERLPRPGDGWDAAMRFLLETRTTRDTIYAVPAEFNAALAEKAVVTRQASAFMEFVNAPFHPLAAPVTKAAKGAPSFPEVMLKRRTSRRFADQPMTEQQLSTLLYFGWGMTTNVPNPLGDVFVRKTSPSGGSLHSIEIYPIVLNVEGVRRGCYHYSVRRHGLEELSTADPAEWLVRACGDQEWVTEAAVVFLCTAFLPRTAWKYNYSRVGRAVMSEIGYSGQSALLTAAWLGLGAFTTAALRDEIFEDVLGLDPGRQPAFLITGAGHLEADIPDHARPRKESVEPVEGS